MCYSCRSNPSCPNNRNSRTLRFVFLFRTQHAASLLCDRLLAVFRFHLSVFRSSIHLALCAEACFLQSGAYSLNMIVIAGFYLKLQDAIGHTI